MQIRVTRTGGLVGIPLCGEVDTTELLPDQTRLAEDALRTLQDPDPGAVPHHADGFQYEIAFALADGAPRSVLIDETEVPAALRPIIATAMAHGSLG
ncbi:MAG: protealysin inhibitor emfourin [Chloroflexota bacterium]